MPSAAPPDDLPRARRRRSTPGLLGRLGEMAIDPADTEDMQLRKTMLLLIAGLMNVAACAWLGIYWLMGIKLPTSLPLGYQVASAALLAYFLKTRNFDHYRLAQLSLFLFVPFAIQWSIGSFVSSSGVVLLALLAPISAMIVYGHREAIPWFVAYIVLTVMSGVFDFLLSEGAESGIPMQTVAVFFVLNFTILSTIVFLLFQFFVKQKDEFQAELAAQHDLVRIEREKSENLLVSILPVHVAERLKNRQTTIADGFSDVTVMFADIVDFTRLSERLSPGEVVAMLDVVFTQMDHLTARYGLDKIKTIGDAYMVAGGLSDRRRAYVDAVAEMALDLQHLMRTDAQLARYQLSLHVGIATGPATAGVIGTTRFVYDLWGDTVNIASRLTGEAPAGGIVIDQNTQQRLAGRFDIAPARMVQVKGKDALAAYALLGQGTSTDAKPTQVAA
ncbi:MAG: adenylate/guanylate cyclase domain-containing protein [Burkholderiales bacterium]|nr:adenylate/guanylate cyclase domain-containing protein [Burkholderiales bacterium]